MNSRRACVSAVLNSSRAINYLLSLIEELLIEIEFGQNESEERDIIAPKTRSSLGTPIGLYSFYNVINTSQSVFGALRT